MGEGLLSSSIVEIVECYASRPCVCLKLRRLVRLLYGSESHACEGILECSPWFICLFA